jgi:SAM-dependent methyltransferase
MLESPEAREIARLYAHRFPAAVHERRILLWKTLYEGWFGRYVGQHDAVLEIAPGYCEFINNVPATQERVGIDLNLESRRFAAPGVVLHHVTAELAADVLAPDHFDCVFVSNFFEHCHSRKQLLDVLAAIHKVMKSTGKLLILGPNYKHAGRAYFDYFDHYLPLTDRSMAEALAIAGFVISEQVAQTLPLSTQHRLPTQPWLLSALVSTYLRAPLAWKLFGAQFFIVAHKK